MQNIVANIDNIRFSMENDIENQVGILDQPFQGMDSKFYLFLSKKYLLITRGIF